MKPWLYVDSTQEPFVIGSREYVDAAPTNTPAAICEVSLSTGPVNLTTFDATFLDMDARWSTVSFEPFVIFPKVVDGTANLMPSYALGTNPVVADRYFVPPTVTRSAFFDGLNYMYTYTLLSAVAGQLVITGNFSLCGWVRNAPFNPQQYNSDKRTIVDIGGADLGIVLRPTYPLGPDTASPGVIRHAWNGPWCHPPSVC